MSQSTDELSPDGPFCLNSGSTDIRSVPSENHPKGNLPSWIFQTDKHKSVMPPHKSCHSFAFSLSRMTSGGWQFYSHAPNIGCESTCGGEVDVQDSNSAAIGPPPYNPSFFPIPNQLTTLPTPPTLFRQSLNIQIQLQKCRPSVSCLHCFDHFEWLRGPGLESRGIGIDHSDTGNGQIRPSNARQEGQHKSCSR